MRGFTLLEAVIVMAIIAIISGLGIYGIVRYRSTVELNSVYSELVTSIKKQRNKAINSVVYNPSNQVGITFNAPDFYSLRFNLGTGTYDLYICNSVGSSKLITCIEDGSTETPILPKGTRITASGCESIGFALITSDIVRIDKSAFNGSGGYNSNPNPSTCTLNMFHTQANLTKIITVDFSNETLTF